jgi:cellobiose transport system substrate-binding protein
MRITPRSAVIASTLAGVLAVTAACSGDDNKTEGTSSSGAAKNITLKVDTFGDFGFKTAKLFEAYEASHPGIKIEERNTKDREKVYVPKLLQYLETGSGAGDVVALEEGDVTRFQATPDKFADLNSYGAASLKSDYLEWKWSLGTAGQKVFALGTDVGGLAMCYRSDLFKQAGLPTDRAEVSKLWPTWDDYVATGTKFQDKVKGTKFVDGPVTVFNAILSQEAPKSGGNATYFSEANAYQAGTNPAVKSSFDTVAKLHNAGLTAGLDSFTPPWISGFKKNTFATMACPAWMLGVIKENAGDAYKNKWDIATVPGGGGNWGGSYLAVPAQGKNLKEAAELATYLTNADSQVAIFKTVGPLPTRVSALANPDVKGFVNDYFNAAPVGEIFASGASSLKPIFLGTKNTEVRTAFQSALLAMGQGKLTPDKAWTKAVADGEKVAK